LHYPIHTSPAWREAFSLRRDYNGNEAFAARGHHRRYSINFGMNVVTSEPMFNVTASKHLTVTGKHCTTHRSVPENMSVFAHIPRSCCQLREVALRHNTVVIHTPDCCSRSYNAS